MALAFDYSVSDTPITISITNVINPNSCKYNACDAGAFPIRKLVPYSTIKDIPNIKWDYQFDPNGNFLKGDISEDGFTINTEPDATVDGESIDYIVLATFKRKNTDVKIPAYRNRNGKVLHAAETDTEGKWIGDSMTFTTTDKNEVIHFEKVAAMFGDAIEVKINDKVVGVDYGVAED